MNGKRFDWLISIISNVSIPLNTETLQRIESDLGRTD